MLRMASVGFLALVFLAACSRPGPGPSQSPPGAEAVKAPRTSEAIATPAPPPAAGVAQASSGAVVPPSASKAASSSGSGGGGARSPAKPSGAGHPVKRPAAEERTAPEKPATVESASQKRAAQPTLDLAALEDNLRNTRAIGVFTKLSLKNNVDDLLAAFRAFYNGQLKTTLAELRQRYDILVMKVLTLVQNGDPPLAQALSASRDSIWGILSDREKFQKFSLH